MTGKKRPRGASTSEGRLRGLRNRPLVAPDPVGSQHRRPARSPGRNQKFMKKLKHFLKEHCEGIADAMWDSKSFQMQIPFSTIRANHKQLSDDIVCKLHIKMEQEVQSALVQYLKHHFMKKDLVGKFSSSEEMVNRLRDQAKLTLTDVPDRIEPIEHALDLPLNSNNRHRILFAKHHKSVKVPTITDAQLLILIGSFDHLLECHKHGKSWRGSWTKKNWDLVDGKAILFAPTQPVDADQHSCKLDLAQYADEFLAPFADVAKRFPANMVGLFKELKGPLTLPDHEFFTWYYEFLAYYPCFFTGSARMFLVTGWYHLVEYLHFDKKPEYVPVFDEEVFWTSLFPFKEKVHPILFKVFWRDQKPGSDMPYRNTRGHNFRLIRQLQEHVYRNTKLTGDEQTIEKSDESDLFAEDQYPFVLADLIRSLFVKKQMVGEFLDRYEQFKKLRGPLGRRGG